MKKIFVATLVAILVISFVVPALAQDFSTIKCLSVRETAEELLNFEVSGRQHPDSVCMTQENFPRYKVGVRMAGGGDAEDNREAQLLLGKQPSKIESVTKNSDDYYTVKFEYRLPDGKSLKDQFEFVQYETGELKKLFGCAAITSAPKTLVIHAACLPKN